MTGTERATCEERRQHAEQDDADSEAATRWASTTSKHTIREGSAHSVESVPFVVEEATCCGSHRRSHCVSHLIGRAHGEGRNSARKSRTPPPFVWNDSSCWVPGRDEVVVFCPSRRAPSLHVVVDEPLEWTPEDAVAERFAQLDGYFTPVLQVLQTNEPIGHMPALFLCPAVLEPLMLPDTAVPFADADDDDAASIASVPRCCET